MFLVSSIDKSEFYILFQSAGTFNMQKSPENWAGTLYISSNIYFLDEI